MDSLLLVDDEVAFARSLAEGLADHGFDVRLAHDGFEGYRQAKQPGFDVVVLDLMLPRLSGVEVCRRLRAEDVTTPILMLTAREANSDEADSLDSGADDYLRKPFSFAVLVSRVHALLRRSALGSPPPLGVGDLTVDLRARRVHRAGEELPLTAREFDLLVFLLRRAGQVVSKRQILDGVWDDDFAGDPNVVEVYVARLRRKLSGTDGGAIETVRGAGYRLRRG